MTTIAKGTFPAVAALLGMVCAWISLGQTVPTAVAPATVPATARRTNPLIDGEGFSLIHPRCWSGIVPDDALRDLMPADGFISDQETWAKVWRAWKVGKADDPPAMDFATTIIGSVFIAGPNSANMTVHLGDLDHRVVTTLGPRTIMAGPGFGYYLVECQRDAVQMFNSRPIPPFDPAKRAATTAATTTAATATRSGVTERR